MKMIYVIFDTSFLINAVKAKVDFMKDIRMELGKFTPVLTSPVIRELNNLNKMEARVALELLKDCELFEAKGHADTSVIVAAKEKGGYIASTDKEVRQRARAREIKLITLREGKYLIF